MSQAHRISAHVRRDGWQLCEWQRRDGWRRDLEGGGYTPALRKRQLELHNRLSDRGSEPLALGGRLWNAPGPGRSRNRCRSHGQVHANLATGIHDELEPNAHVHLLGAAAQHRGGEGDKPIRPNAQLAADARRRRPARPLVVGPRRHLSHCRVGHRWQRRPLAQRGTPVADRDRLLCVDADGLEPAEARHHAEHVGVDGKVDASHTVE